MSASKGKVYLIGAGPGDPDLITVKGKEFLHRCDVVLYDNLASDELIMGLPRHIQRRYTGKRASKHSLPQEEINQLLVDLAQQGKIIARLKGGDPFIFGRGGEEASFLKENGIEVEVIPGITSGIAAPMHAGIPCTDRRNASFVTFVTGHKKMGESKEVPWHKMAQAGGGNIVIYMGVGQISHIVRNLMEGGMSANMPAAIIERGTMPGQRVITCDLRSLPQKAKSEKIKSPALFIIGESVALRPQVDWKKYRELDQTRIMAVHNAQERNICRELREQGAEVIPCITAIVENFYSDQSWQEFQKLEQEELWLIFREKESIQYFIEQFSRNMRDLRSLARYKIAAHASTIETLQKFYLQPDIILSEENKLQTSEKKCLIEICDSDQSKFPPDRFLLPIYRYAVLPILENYRDKIFDRPPAIIYFLSTAATHNFFKIFTKEEWQKLFDQAIIACSPHVSSILSQYGAQPQIEVYQADTLAKALSQRKQAEATESVISSPG